MKFLIVLAVAVGVANAFPSVFLQNTADVQAATQNFVQEYNRLAKLAAEAPDIHIYHEDPNQPRIQPAHTHQRAQNAPNPLQNFQFYTFSANLGGQNQFQPSQITRSFGHAPVRQVPAHRPVQQVHRPAQPVAHQHPVVVRQVAAQPIKKWTGPFADTVPAGVESLPRDVTPTPEVSAARNAHFSILVDAYKQAAATRQHNVV